MTKRPLRGVATKGTVPKFCSFITLFNGIVTNKDDNIHKNENKRKYVNYETDGQTYKRMYRLVTS